MPDATVGGAIVSCRRCCCQIRCGMESRTHVTSAIAWFWSSRSCRRVHLRTDLLPRVHPSSSRVVAADRDGARATATDSAFIPPTLSLSLSPRRRRTATGGGELKHGNQASGGGGLPRRRPVAAGSVPPPLATAAGLRSPQPASSARCSRRPPLAVAHRPCLPQPASSARRSRRSPQPATPAGIGRSQDGEEGGPLWCRPPHLHCRRRCPLSAATVVIIEVAITIYCVVEVTVTIHCASRSDVREKRGRGGEGEKEEEEGGSRG